MAYPIKSYNAFTFLPSVFCIGLCTQLCAAPCIKNHHGIDITFFVDSDGRLNAYSSVYENTADGEVVTLHITEISEDDMAAALKEARAAGSLADC